MQILSDGAGAEQAVGYQVFTAELLMVVAALLVERDGQAPNRWSMPSDAVRGISQRW